MRWLRFWWGRSIMRPAGWDGYLGIIERRDLMTRRDDEGRLILVGLGIEFGLRRPLWQHSDAPIRLWPYLRLYSDASEIAERIAG